MPIILSTVYRWQKAEAKGTKALNFENRRQSTPKNN